MRDVTAGVFETLLVRDGRVQALDRHLDRLGASAEQLYGATLPSGLDARAREHAAPLIGLHRLRIDALPAPWSPGASGPGSELPDLEIDLTATALDPSRPDRYACALRRLPEGQSPAQASRPRRARRATWRAGATHHR